jgi:tetratricopeptide (TPR) repeat protein
LVAFLSTPLVGQVTEVESPAAATLNVTSASASASQLFWEAISEAQNVATATSVNILDRAIAIDANFGMALAMKAFLDPTLTSAERSSTFSRAIESMGDATPGEITFATALREWRSGNLQTAVNLLKTASILAPGDANIAHYHAVLAGNMGNPEERIALWRSVLERFPNHGAAQNQLAYRLYEAGDVAGAVEMVSRYLETMPNHWNAHDSFAEISQWEGRFSDALTHYRRVVEIAPDLLQGYVGQAEVFQMMDRGDDARAKLTEALAVATTDAARINLHLAIGNSFTLDEERREAVESYGTAADLATDAGNANLASLAYQEMALSEALLGNTSNAIRTLTSAAEAGGPESRQVAFEALVHAMDGEIGAAKEKATALTTITESEPGFTNLSHQVNAIIMVREGNPEGAITELEKTNAGNIFTRVLTAEALKKMGKDADARSIRTEVLNDRTINLNATNWVVARVRAQKM